eukprot:CAMPEP_0204350936 /NCGR_PEP_ID=MMETSP0469-20131031/30726_1 /ASSEMBLY_ACC=CAM_ASM_000384 /TAXON_ID=2969 /ORGANISM="Oxyrrhis marina" /LENGTH=196 /DNA_ID=CAMNT_0051337385 /DNA_START=170 /DNA_END=761 /DNA_ORIENTATION=-
MGAGLRCREARPPTVDGGIRGIPSSTSWPLASPCLGRNSSYTALALGMSECNGRAPHRRLDAQHLASAQSPRHPHEHRPRGSGEDPRLHRSQATARVNHRPCEAVTLRGLLTPALPCWFVMVVSRRGGWNHESSSAACRSGQALASGPLAFCLMEALASPLCRGGAYRLTRASGPAVACGGCRHWMDYRLGLPAAA